MVLVLARGCRWLSPGPLLCSWVPSSDTWTKRVFVPTSVTVLASCVGPADLQRGGLGVRSGPSERPGGLAWAARGRPEAGCAEPQEALPATWAPQSGVVPGPAGQDGAPSTAPASSREDQQRARGPVGPGEDGSSDFWACSLQSLAHCSRAVTPRSRRASLWPHSTPPSSPHTSALSPGGDNIREPSSSPGRAPRSLVPGVGHAVSRLGADSSLRRGEPAHCRPAS